MRFKYNTAILTRIFASDKTELIKSHADNNFN